MAKRRPLAGLCVLDLVEGPLGPATRYLAELGADVVHLASTEPDLTTRGGLEDFAAHAGKRTIVVGRGLEFSQATLAAELDAADVVVIDASHGIGRSIAPEIEALRERFPATVFVTCSNFGLGNSYSGWAATDPVLHALSGELSRSGIRGMPPLLPPGELAFQCAAVQLAYVILLAVYRRQQTGHGEHVDFSALDGAMQALDPGYGISGSATMGRPARLLSPERPPRGFQYPIFPCADGFVRICVLAARQWRGMFEWMGKPEEFASPEFEKVAVRFKSTTLNPTIGAFFADKTRAKLEEGARRHGVPLSALLDGNEAICNAHFTERNVFAERDVPGYGSIPLPNGILEIDGARMAAGIAVGNKAKLPVVPPAVESDRPFSGLRVLDLGVIVVGGEQSRLLADNGADVIKVESRAFPDGTRQTDLAIGISVSFAAGHRNKRSLGLNLRSPEGRAIFERMVASADVVLSNFKPGTLESLGLDYASLTKIKPDIIVVESSAFGANGPWAERMGYGPLVRAATGLTKQWRYPGDPDSFSDSVTIYPDHVAGRVTVLGVIALLIDRLRSGRGGHVESSQAEVVLAHQDWRIAAARTGLVDASGPPDAPWGAFQAAGDDDWCVVTVRNHDDWRALCGLVPGLDVAMDRPLRIRSREALESIVADWVSKRSADDVMQTLQAVEVPAARMLRVAELPEFGYFAERNIFRQETHPYLAEPYHAEAMHARFETIAPPAARPAPVMGEHTAEVMRHWLSMDEAEINELVARGVLEPVSDEIATVLASIKASAA